MLPCGAESRQGKLLSCIWVLYTTLISAAPKRARYQWSSTFFSRTLESSGLVLTGGSEAVELSAYVAVVQLLTSTLLPPSLYPSRCGACCLSEEDSSLIEEAG